MSDLRNNPQYGWSREEKKHLYDALEINGHNDLYALKKAVPTKSKKSIQNYLNYFKKIAEWDLQSDFTDITEECNPRRRLLGDTMLKTPQDAPICQWVNIFGENSKSPNLTLSIALQLIGHLEHHPSSDEYSGVELKDLYLYLGSALAGEIPESLDPKSMGLLTCALTDLATKTKKCRTTADIEFIQGITLIHKETSDPTMNNDPSTVLPKEVSEVLKSSFYNPLVLPAHFLKRYPDK